MHGAVGTGVLDVALCPRHRPSGRHPVHWASIPSFKLEKNQLANDDNFSGKGSSKNKFASASTIFFCRIGHGMAAAGMGWRLGELDLHADSI